MYTYSHIESTDMRQLVQLHELSHSVDCCICWSFRWYYGYHLSPHPWWKMTSRDSLWHILCPKHKNNRTTGWCFNTTVAIHAATLTVGRTELQLQHALNAKMLSFCFTMFTLYQKRHTHARTQIEWSFSKWMWFSQWIVDCLLHF